MARGVVSMFGGGRGFGQGAALAALALVGMAVPSAAPALTIVPDYSALGGTAQQDAQIEASFNTIIAQFEALYLNPVTVNVAVELAPGAFLGENSTFQIAPNYNSGAGNFVTALTNTINGATTTNVPGQTALAHLPASAAAVNSSDTANTIQITTPNARAIGLSAATASDATIFFSSSFPLQFSRVNGQIGISNYDFFGTAEHELDEVLGLGSAMACDLGAQCSDSTLPTTIRPEDLFRYDQNGARTFTFSAAAQAFLSINGGASDLIQLNQDFNGDYGDFFSRDFPGTTQDQNAPCVAIVQNAFSCNGQVASVQHDSVETQLLAAMGWNPRFSTAAASTVWLVDCNAGTIASTGAVATASIPVTNPLGALLGTPSGPGTFTTLPVAGDTIEITGLCVQDVTVRTSGLTITDHEGPDGTSADTSDADGVQGQLELAAANQTVISGLLLGNFGGGFIFASGADLATLFVHDGATVVMLHTDVVNSPGYGMLARREAQVTLLDDRFIFDGFNTGFPGVAVLTNSKAVFGADDGSLAVTVEGSGGDGVVASVGSSVIFHGASLTGNGGHQLSIQSASSARLSGSGVTVNVSDVIAPEGCGALHGAACGTAIVASGSSMLRIESGASVMALDSGSPASLVGAIAVRQGSSLLTQGATIEALAGAPAAVTAGENSVIALAGGNQICGGTCDGSTTGVAIVLDHVSTLIDVAPAEFGYGAGIDQIFGNGQVQLQSTVDLGIGPAGGGGPNLTWNTGSGASIVVAQNSSFRLQGGVSITGGVALGQGSNGFFNTAAGGTNVVSVGVTCPFTAIPSAHVVTGNTSSLSPSPPIAVSFLSASPAAKQCLPF